LTGGRYSEVVINSGLTVLTKMEHLDNEYSIEYLLFDFYQRNTVKPGYNELGYNEHPVITNKVEILDWFG